MMNNTHMMNGELKRITLVQKKWFGTTVIQMFLDDEGIGFWSENKYR